ncbi:hypothetical protein [Bradyrhizobium genomosp. III]|uniref:hypothetical protein n=1 Tax=Bradyrhizobium genomosp. III TaxID=2683271 RepID=UPI0018733654|nr:hypothetical protein [Bradyrhizobium sp. CCBAU 15635]
MAEAHAQIGGAKLYMGRGAETEAHIKEAFRLSRDIFAHRWFMIVGFATARALCELVTTFTIRRLRDGAYSDHPVYLVKRERIYDGLRLAGVSEE